MSRAKYLIRHSTTLMGELEFIQSFFLGDRGNSNHAFEAHQELEPSLSFSIV